MQSKRMEDLVACSAEEVKSVTALERKREECCTAKGQCESIKNQSDSNELSGN